MGAGAAGASISKAGGRRNDGHRGKRRKLRLVTAEAIAPKMKVGKAGSFDGKTARLKLRCPKKERSGPCHGKARLLSKRTGDVLASGSFRIPRAHSAKVAVSGPRLDGYRGPLHGMYVRVRGADQLGNATVVERKVHLQRVQGPRGPNR
jgi:hypothetical protein